MPGTYSDRPSSNSVSLKSVERAWAANDGEPPGVASVEAPMADGECSARDVAEPKPRVEVTAPQTNIIDVDDSDSADPTPYIKLGIIQLVRK